MMTALGVLQSSKPGSKINAVITQIEGSELPKFDAREVKYKRTAVSVDSVTFLTDNDKSEFSLVCF